ncbi:hypothetical protein FRACYDRAFT_237518 [Fragilariopsis cylindrus CCMP1102]|uniref:Uncharacterized protein n=1 Tax=Fragilariopsis cylindrus CCMP1102 TaxID=635003 RepID=A0A1E7FG12_9STRA|nr:hypothetical protein FRACYDRAFT_237518 [Fragilariopsis cylindrus CCMP1102]|eukprot:OEU17110.1 hypothetical protein FRACYDRAFT_237518 [Fragilariopsis cylindrus CCMP1102]
MTLPPYHVSTITNDDDDTPNLTDDEKLEDMLATQLSLKAKIADHKANANSDTSAGKFADMYDRTSEQRKVDSSNVENNAREAEKLAKAKRSKLNKHYDDADHIEHMDVQKATLAAEATRAKASTTSTLFGSLGRTFASVLTSPFSAKAPVNNESDTPRTSLEKHANHVYDNLVKPLEEEVTLTYGPDPLQALPDKTTPKFDFGVTEDTNFSHGSNQDGLKKPRNGNFKKCNSVKPANQNVPSPISCQTPPDYLAVSNPSACPLADSHPPARPSTDSHVNHVNQVSALADSHAHQVPPPSDSHVNHAHQVPPPAHAHPPAAQHAYQHTHPPADQYAYQHTHPPADQHAYSRTSYPPTDQHAYSRNSYPHVNHPYQPPSPDFQPTSHHAPSPAHFPATGYNASPPTGYNAYPPANYNAPPPANNNASPPANYNAPPPANNAPPPANNAHYPATNNSAHVNWSDNHQHPTTGHPAFVGNAVHQHSTGPPAQRPFVGNAAHQHATGPPAPRPFVGNAVHQHSATGPPAPRPLVENTAHQHSATGPAAPSHFAGNAAHQHSAARPPATQQAEPQVDPVQQPYQATNPSMMQPQHPCDANTSVPNTVFENGYQQSLNDGIAQRSPLATYRQGGSGSPSGDMYHPPLSNTNVPYRPQLTRNPNFQQRNAQEEYHRMHPNASAADLAIRFGSPITQGCAQAPHTSNGGYGYPTPQQNHPNNVRAYNMPETPYSHAAAAAYQDQSQETSMGTSVRGIKYRSSISRKDLHWNGNKETFETYKTRLFGIMLQNGTSYLIDENFVNEYQLNKHHIYSGTFWDRYGITAQQCMFDISWLSGVLTTTIDDPENIPEITSARGDGVHAVVNLLAAFVNGGDTEQETKWKLRDEINKKFYPSKMTFETYMKSLQTNILKMQRLDPTLRKDQVIDQLEHNIIDQIPTMHYLFDQIRSRDDPWTSEFKYLIKRGKHYGKTQRDGILPTHLLTATSDLREINNIDELRDEVTNAYVAFQDKFTENGNKHPQLDAARAVYNVFKKDPTRLNLSVPPELWNKLDEPLKKQITRIQQEIRDEQRKKPKDTSKDKASIGQQYPTLNKPPLDVRKTLTAIQCIQELGISGLLDDDESIDEEMEDYEDEFINEICNINMASVYGEFYDDEDTIDIKANYRLAYKCVHEGKIFGISDGGADSCILGKHAHVINRTKRYVRLVGYDPATTQSDRVPIVSAYLKTKDQSGDIILLLIHESPYLAHSSTTLLSEYQIREYGKVIDSCSTSHVHRSNPRVMGLQRLEINEDIHVPMEDRGAIMGIQILPYEEGDDSRYNIHEIVSKSPWLPQRYRYKDFPEDISSNVTSESQTTITATAAPAITNSTLNTAAINAASTEPQVTTVDDDDELTQRLEKPIFEDNTIDPDESSQGYQATFEAETISVSGKNVVLASRKLDELLEQTINIQDTKYDWIQSELAPGDLEKIDELAHNQLRKHNYESMTKSEGKHIIGKIRNDMINDVAKCYGLLDLSDACMSPYLDKVEEIFNRLDNEKSLSEILQQMLDEDKEKDSPYEIKPSVYLRNLYEQDRQLRLQGLENY